METNNKILYVDDEEINLQLFEINMGERYHVFTADSASAGIEILATDNDIAVVISDMKMPQMNGIEFIKMAREKYPAISYYILTGFDINNEIQDALQNGLILRYFRKPFNMNEIENEIIKAIEQ